jgi:hypothetical protein
MKERFMLCFSLYLWRCEWEQLRLYDQERSAWIILHWDCGEQDPQGKSLVLTFEILGSLP